MRLHEIIREKRKALELTQEQAAARLGITASAFNKWERGISCPDITILPALARLLETDLNTLLSFQEDLTNQEIALWCEQISDLLLKDGFEAAYQMAMEKIQEYPGSGALLYHMACTLEGGLMMFAPVSDEEKKQSYLEEINALYERAAASKDEAVRNQANALLAAKWMNNGEYDKAQEKIELLPEPSWKDKRQMQAQLYCRMERYDEAARLKEEKILESANDIYADLLILMEIAVKEERFEDAAYLAEKAVQTTKVYELWEYSALAVRFQLAVSIKDKEAALSALSEMLTAIEKDWKPWEMRLYSHVEKKEGGERRREFQKRLKEQILSAIKTDEEMAFLREEEEFQRILKRNTGISVK